MQKGVSMVYNNLLIVLIVSQQVWAMDTFIKANTRPLFYDSVLPGYISDKQVPSLRLLSAQRIHEMNRRGQLTPEQRITHEATICNDFLNQDFSYMRKDRAQRYALGLFGAPVPQAGRGNIAQKKRALEMMIKANS